MCYVAAVESVSDLLLARVTDALERLSPPGLVSAYVFGSVAEDRSHNQSDIDLGVVFDPSALSDSRARFEAQLDMRRHLSPSSIGREVDIVVLNDASPALGRRIVLSGQRVYCRDTKADHGFRRNVLIRAAELEPFLQRMRRRLHDRLAQ